MSRLTQNTGFVSHIARTVFLLCTVVLLHGCSSSEGDIGGTGGVNNTPSTGAPSSESAPAALLAPAGSSDAFAEYMTSGLRTFGGLEEESESLEQVLASPFPSARTETALPEADQSTPEFAASDSTAVASTQVSQTNVIVSGVDELDAAKYDGSYLYLANTNRLTIASTPVSGEMQTLADLPLGNGERFGRVQGLYLREHDAGRQVVAVQGISFGFAFGIAELSILPYYGDDEVVIDFVDATDPSSPSATNQLKIDGSLLESRRVGNVLYLVTQYSPRIDGYVVFPGDEETRARNETLLEETEPDDLVPFLELDGVRSPLVDETSCLLPNTEVDAARTPYPTLVSVTAFNLDTLNVDASACMADGVWGTHATPDALYIASPGRSTDPDGYYEETSIHKFSLNDGISYTGSGSVPGSFWGDPAFLMAESNGQLVAITTQPGDEEDRFDHRLTILDEAPNSQLEVVGSIPNEQRPEAIGKPNEQIFSSRILDNRAYVVTFEQIDPVYTIDLSNPADPQIIGELEIPGFSSYLHPVAENLILGVGNNTNVSPEGFVTNDGVNVRLFDVTGAPQLVGELTFGRQWSFSPVSFDYKAFTFLNRDNDMRVAIPITRYGSHATADPKRAPWTDNALHLMTVSDISGSPALTSDGQVTAEDHSTGERYQSGCCNWQSRSFLNGDTIFYLNKNRLFRAPWDNPSTTDNLFINTLFDDGEECFGRERENFNPVFVSLFDRDSGDFLTCRSLTPFPEEPGILEPPVEEEESEGESEDEEKGETTVDDSDGAIASSDELTLLPVEECSDATLTFTPEISGPGSYDLTVEKLGYEVKTLSDIRVQGNSCGLGSSSVNVHLVPE